MRLRWWLVSNLARASAKETLVGETVPRANQDTLVQLALTRARAMRLEALATKGELATGTVFQGRASLTLEGKIATSALPPCGVLTAKPTAAATLRTERVTTLRLTT